MIGIFDFVIGGILGAGLVAMGWIMQRMRNNPVVPDVPAVLLFHDGVLRDMTADARPFLPTCMTTVADLQAFLSDAFPTLSLTDIGDDGLSLNGRLPGWHLLAEGDAKALRVTVQGLAGIAAAQRMRDAALLDRIAAHAPQLIWQQTGDGRILWSGAAYRHAVTAIQPPDGLLFPKLSADQDHQPQRVQPAGDDGRWFDVTSTQQDGCLTCFATETTDLVRADAARREYVKTLGRTFGDLATGLAIFDRNRQLKMFNPALLEMSKLPFAFLSARPRIDTVFDRMRELQMMPEPKDYATWREQFTAVETGAKQGTYCENWPLPDGQTFRVTGRPHPDGAFALLFEDITAEVSLTRRFRSEIETSQAVLDSLPDAIAVFSHSGTLIMTNAAYGTLWECEHGQFENRAIWTETDHWRENTVASPIWGDVLAVAQQKSGRKPWCGDALLLDGRPLRCHAVPLDGGMTLIRFAMTPTVRPVVQKLTQRDPTIRMRGG